MGTSKIREMIITWFEERSEFVFTLLVTVSAILCAFVNMYNGRYGGSMMMSNNDKGTAYVWYHAKAIRENLAKNNLELITFLAESGAIPLADEAKLKAQLEGMEAAIVKIKKEKQEILLGSKTVGESLWAQDVDGKLGQVLGAKEIEADINMYWESWKKFELASLVTQICLALSAIGLVMKNSRLRILVVLVITSLLIHSTVLMLMGLALVT